MQLISGSINLFAYNKQLLISPMFSTPVPTTTNILAFATESLFTSFKTYVLPNPPAALYRSSWTKSNKNTFTGPVPIETYKVVISQVPVGRDLYRLVLRVYPTRGPEIDTLVYEEVGPVVTDAGACIGTCLHSDRSGFQLGIYTLNR